jgi:hypothetical protein
LKIFHEVTELGQVDDGTEKDPEINSFVYDQWAFTKGAKAVQWGMVDPEQQHKSVEERASSLPHTIYRY